jgi:hypothetical protein
MSPVLDTIRTEVEATEGVVDSAIVFINGVQAKIDAAVATALENGATQDQLAPFVDLSAELGTKRQALADAIAAQGG